MSKGQGTNVFTSGPILILNWKPGDHDLNYTCTARNPVSNSSRTVLAKEFCAGSTASRENNAPVVVTGILGESAILPADIPDKNKIDNINWASRTPVAVVTPEGTSVNIITTHLNYKGRLNVSSKTYDLQINHLKMEDAGFYRADINLKTSSTSTTITKNYTLQIYSKTMIVDS
uniref:Immunoglobulin V-set domain-containing protein n=1 Tax=Monodelphis domestica TaxID=13616 RepID=A0A5F8H892_MONDO